MRNWNLFFLASIVSGVAMGIVVGALSEHAGFFVDPAMGATLGCLAGIIWASVFGPPKHSCGLEKGVRYRVITSFRSGSVEFREGEVVIFKGERRFVPEDDPTPEHDLYHFADAYSMRAKTISSEAFPDPSAWIGFLEEVG